MEKRAKGLTCGRPRRSASIGSTGSVRVSWPERVLEQVTKRGEEYLLGLVKMWKTIEAMQDTGRFAGTIRGE